ncbi:hypothetical protein GGR50DRAFT_655205 [Xylaria sp. CBS 124048]|nr:hypothetical protein GGR50DRAFT_655205 [Xylaria sp. CBS 124048]
MHDHIDNHIANSDVQLIPNITIFITSFPVNVCAQAKTRRLTRLYRHVRWRAFLFFFSHAIYFFVQETWESLHVIRESGDAFFVTAVGRESSRIPSQERQGSIIHPPSSFFGFILLP